LFEKYLKSIDYSNKQQCLGTWVHHPWSGYLYHLLDQDSYLKLRTLRHRNVLTWKQQQSLFFNKVISVIGLSTGKNIILSMIRYGIGSYYKMADKDIVSLSNINRALYDLHHVSHPKIEIVDKAISRIDPFIGTELYKDGISHENLHSFVKDSDIIIDAFDSFKIKIELRKLAKKYQIPVISGFDIEKGFLLIVERYDIEKGLDLDLFLNGKTEEYVLQAGGEVANINNIFLDIIGKDLHSEKMYESVSKVGSFLTGYPQLIVASFLGSSLITHIVEKIFLGGKLSSRRIFLSLDEII
jgi:molybdopterin/thiamine biosynthesis adenylyltransferase